MELVDIGCNLAHDSFDADRDAVLAAARAAGVVQMVVTGASRPGARDARDLARAHPGELFATAGVHPHHATDFDDATEAEFRELYSDPAVVAVGECGLDYYRDFSPRDVQREVFERHLNLAAETGKPLFLHQRDAHGDFQAILGEWRDKLGPVVVHCFTDTREALHACLDLDLHVGITGWICDERRGHHLKEFVHEIPPDRLMIETDAPYLKPRNLRPKVKTRRNEPQWLPWIAGTVAALRGVSPVELARQTTATARAFFGLPVRAEVESA